MNLSSLPNKILGRLRWAAHWRCAEPVVIFESDDWGMQRGGNLSAFEPYGKPKGWAAEMTETPTALDALYAVLESHPDRHGRPAVFTTNFITANPDFEAIEANHFSEYMDIPVSADGTLRSAWETGIQRSVFYPQYHGRSHINVQKWLDDLKQDVPGAQALFNKRQNGGLALLENAQWRYHSEYINWQTGEMSTQQDLASWINVGLQYFEDAFGFLPKSAIAPHYVLPTTVLPVWRQLGIHFVQGGNYHILQHPQSGQQIYRSHALGERSTTGLLYLTRNVRFEPRPGQINRGVEAAWRQIEGCFKAGIPAVIDTHRINYTGPWQVAARQALFELLTRIAAFQPRFMTSTELGEAIRSGGSYHDAWDQKAHTLHPQQSLLGQFLRRIFSQYHSRLIGKA